jgi:hypothetical protein
MSIAWWMRQIVLILVGCFFLMFGIQLLVAAYRLPDPIWFILTFFASNFVILISATLLAGFVYRVVTALKQTRLRQ